MCGGVRAFATEGNEPLSPGDFIGKWMNLITPAAEKLGKEARTASDYIQRLEFAAIELSLSNLMTFPCIRILAEKGRIALHGAYFGVSSGMLLVRNPATGEFAPVVEGMEPAPRFRAD